LFYNRFLVKNAQFFRARPARKKFLKKIAIYLKEAGGLAVFIYMNSKTRRAHGGTPKEKTLLPGPARKNALLWTAELLCFAFVMV
jgi:hypothetical protein